MADRLPDISLRGTILAFRVQVNFLFLRLREALEDSRECEKLLPASDSWHRVQALCWKQAALYHLGRSQEAAELRTGLDPLAKRIGHVAAISWNLRIAAWTEFGARPDFARLIESLSQDLNSNRAAGLEDFVALSRMQLIIAEFYRGNWDRALEHAQEGLGPQAPRRTQLLGIGGMFRQKAYAGDRDGALALLPDISDRLPGSGQSHPYRSWVTLLLVIEGLAVISEREQAAAFYPIVRELIDTGMVCAMIASRFPQTVAGIAAAAACNWDAAEEHFQIAARQAQDFPHLVELAEVRRFHGAALLSRRCFGVNTEFRLAWRRGLESALLAHPSEIAP